MGQPIGPFESGDGGQQFLGVFSAFVLLEGGLAIVAIAAVVFEDFAEVLQQDFASAHP